MAFKSLKAKLIGESDLLCHNGAMADPRNPFAKAIKRITDKRKRTDADFDEIAHLEFLGGLYRDKTGHPCIPGEVIEGVIAHGARKLKMGDQAKAGIYCNGNWRIANGGADISDVEQLWKSGEYHLTIGVSNKANTIMRTRPRFKTPWSVECEIFYNDELVNEEDVLRFLNNPCVGIGDWIPKFGRFKAKKL